MIAYLEGRLLDVSGKGCVLLTPGGVGYELALPSTALVALPQKGGTVALFTHMRWRSSMAEQLTCNQQVAGSSPIASSSEWWGSRVAKGNRL